MPSILYTRQTSGSVNDPNAFDNSDYPYDGYEESWWWSSTGMAVRYAIIAVLFALVLLYFVGGYWHAKRRISKNLAPLPYHRWMVNRRRYQPANQQWYNHQQPNNAYGQPHYQNQDTAYAGSYGMQGYAPPPPAYDAHMAPPPVYQPPQGGSKVAADQHYTAVSGGQQQRSGESSEASAASAPPARNT